MHSLVDTASPWVTPVLLKNCLLNGFCIASVYSFNHSMYSSFTPCFLISCMISEDSTESHAISYIVNVVYNGLLYSTDISTCLTAWMSSDAEHQLRNAVCTIGWSKYSVALILLVFILVKILLGTQRWLFLKSCTSTLPAYTSISEPLLITNFTAYFIKSKVKHLSLVWFIITHQKVLFTFSKVTMRIISVLLICSFAYRL